MTATPDQYAWPALRPCPCGVTPDHLILMSAEGGDSPKYAYATCPACGDWIVEFRAGWRSLSTDAATWAAAARDWNAARRGGDQ